MPFNGSGTYSLPSGNPVATNTPISSTVQNATTSDIATALTNCVTRDGQSPPTTPLPMGNQKITGLAKGTVAGDAVRYEQAAKIDESTGANSDIKSLSGLTTPLSVAQGGTGSSTAPTTTGTGDVVLNNSPTLITPVLGTPSSGNLSNCTFPTLNQNTTGSAASATTATSANGLKTASGIVSVSSATAPSTGQVLVATSGTAATWQSLPTGTGTVTSVAMTVPSFLSVTGSPVTSTGTLAVSLSGTALPVENGGTGNTTGTATINANLTGAITSVGNAASLGSFTSANLAAALTDETGTGANVFANAPTFPAQINLTANTGYNIYASGTADNYLAGSLGIGTTSLTGFSMHVSKNATGATTVNQIAVSGAIQSDVTSQARQYTTFLQTSGAVFTIGEVFHYCTQQGSFGSTTVTNQYGFSAGSSLTGATNNYGFYGGIASGTGRYNLYMAGTADNYLAGNLGVGSLPVSSITAVGAGQTTASLNTSGTLGGALIVGDSGTSAGNGGAIVFSGASTAWRFAAIKGMATNGASNSQGDLVISVRPSATDATLTEAFRIGSSKNATFAGSVGIGATAGAQNSLLIGGTAYSFGTATYSVLNNVTIPSSSTAAAVIFSTSPSLAAASFNVTALYHFSAVQGTFGAGSTSTTQIGFYLDGSLTGATNNYGFYGGIAAGTGRYNLYMAGTADNYLAGKLMVGSTQGVGTIYSFASGASNGTIDSRTGLHIQNNNATTGVANARIQFSFAANTPKAYIEAGLYGNDYLAFGSSAGATENMRIDYLGNVGIGTASPDASSRLTIGGTPSVSSPVGQLVNATFSSAATGTAISYSSLPNTAAASFTLGTMIGFKAAQGTIGAASAVTSQYGYLAESNLTGATNNVGFFGNIAAASGRYNFYAAGTAANAFSGDVNIFGAGKLGYTTGSGGTVTQATSRTTDVTLNKTNGSITLVSAAGSASYQSFIVNNSTVSATDVVVLSVQSGLSNKYNIIPYAVGTGIFGIHVAAVSGTATEAPVINFAVIKAVNA